MAKYDLKNAYNHTVLKITSGKDMLSQFFLSSVPAIKTYFTKKLLENLHFEKIVPLIGYFS